MRTGRPKQPLVLSDEERAKLEQWVRRPKTAQRLALRSRIVLGCAEGLSNQAVAHQCGTSPHTVGKWRERFRTARLEGLADEPRPGAPREITDREVEEVVTRTLESPPPEATQWSTRAMAQATGLSHMAVARIWRAFGLQPHRVESFKLSKDKCFVEKLTDVVGVYMNPPDKAVVLCVDEKSQIQALDRTQQGLPMKKGRCGTMTHDYERNGTTCLFAALNVLEGKVIGSCYPKHRNIEFRKFLRRIDRETPKDLAIHMILDNYGTHNHPMVKAWLEKHPRFHCHFTPTSSSWLNLVERWFGELTRKRIRRGVFRSVTELVSAIEEFIRINNENPKPFIWTKKVDAILEKIAHCKAVTVTPH